MFRGTNPLKTILAAGIFLTAGLMPETSLAGPSAETTKRCLHYSCVLYRYKRPGSVRTSGDRPSYFKDCMAKNGDVPEPTPAGL